MNAHLLTALSLRSLRSRAIIRLACLTLVIAAVAPPAFAQKPDPRGLVRLLAVNYSRPEKLQVWSNSSLSGVRLRPKWGEIQPNATSTNWNKIDTVLTLAHEHGKFVGLSVAAGVYTPSWVYGSGATKYNLQDGSGESMPLPWDSAFQHEWLAFIRDMGARYDGHPSLRYVVISGLGQIVETYLAQNATDSSRLTNLGGPSAWISAAKTIISAYANAFPTTPFIITAAKPFPTTEGVAALEHVIDWGVATYPGRFGIMNCTLNAQSNTGYYPNEAIYSYRGSEPVGFQTICSYDRDPRRMQGTLQQAINAGLGLGAKYIEIYQRDADDSANQQMLAYEASLF